MQKVTIKRSLKKKNVTIHIMPDASIIVSAPYFFPASKINKLLEEKQDWIFQKQQEVQLRNKKLPGNELAIGDELFYLGQKYPLELRQHQKNIVEFEQKFYVASFNQRSIKTYLMSWYKQQARKIIQQRVTQFANQTGAEYNIVKITDAQTRWGSCSQDKNLNFNWRLIMAPLPVIDYVVAHELAHLKEMNHSRDFWETVRKISPLYRQYRTWLRRNGDTLVI